MTVIRKSDWVELTRWRGMTGTVMRASVANGWADVNWGPWAGTLRKRVPIERLKVLHTIPFGGAGVMTTQESRRPRARRAHVG